MLGDPSDLMNGGKWVTIADITDLGHSKREKGRPVGDAGRTRSRAARELRT